LSSIALLCDIIAHQGKTAAATYCDNPNFQTLIRYGFVHENGVVGSVACLECDAPHDAEIVFEQDQYGYFCPEHGFVPISRAFIEAVEPNLSNIVERLADCFNCKRRKSTPLRGTTWRIGTIASESGDVSLYFHPLLLGEQDVSELNAALSTDVKSTYRLVMTANGRLPVPNVKTVPLADITELQPDQPGFDVLVDLHDLVDASRKNRGGSPNRYQKTLEPLILSRMRDGRALQGRNEEANAILAFLVDQSNSDELPSLSSIRYYVSKNRRG